VTFPRSNVISETTINPNTRLSISAKLVYEQTTKRVSQKTLSVRYLNDDFAANLDYLLDEKELEQVAVSVVYPINPRWTMVAKYSESILLAQTIESQLGVNYESCCWGIKIIASQTADDLFTETVNAVFFELTLKGLSKIYSQVKNVVPENNP
jgi:LPS-assembly protein